MAGENQRYAADVLAGLCVERAFAQGRLGVFAENVPGIDLRAFVASISNAVPEPARLALLGSTSSMGRAPSNLEITTDPMTANKWRNDEAARKGRRGIFVVVGPAPKINSLRTAVPMLTAGDIRGAVVHRCQAALDTPGRAAFLNAIAERTGEIGIGALLAYGSAVEDVAAKGKASLMDAEPKLLKKLGLLPSVAAFGATGVVGARKFVRRNLDLINALKAQRDRDTLSALIESKHAFSGRASAIMRFQSSGRLEDLGELTLDEIEEALRTRIDESPSRPSVGGSSRRRRLDGDALALDLILNDDGRGLQVAAKRFGEALEPDPDGVIDAEEIKVGRQVVLPRPKVGTTQATTLFGKYMTEEVWGCLISTDEAVDFVSAQKLVASGDADVEEFRPDEETHVRGTLKKAADRGIADKTVLERWDAYAAAREALLPYAGTLVDHPLLALSGDKKVAPLVRALLESYKGALVAVQETAKALKDAGSAEAAKRLSASVLVLDVAFIRARDEFAAVAAPTHPFHLWRWLALADVASQNRDELRTLGQEVLEPLVTDPPAACPQLLLSPFAVKAPLTGSRPFIATGSFASLPLFGEPSARQLGKFRVRSLAKIVERFLRLMPHAGFGLRVAFVDPPSVAGALEDLLDIENPLSEKVVPLHATILRTRDARETTDEEDDAVTILARELTDQGGSLTVVPGMPSLKEVAEHLASHPAHLAMVFDPGAGERINVGLAQPPTLSPLVLPRAYHYDEFDDRLDVIIAGDAEPFSTYHDMFCDSLGVPRTDFVGRRSGASQSVRHLESVARSAVWTVVVDHAVEPTLRIGAAERLDWRSDGGRDVVTFTAHPQTIEDLIGDAIRSTGLMPDEEMRKRVLTELFLLNGEAVLALAKARPSVSMTDPRIAKAAIGVLAANRWYAEHHPESLVISLDDPTSRQWILGVASDDRRGDLLGIRPTNDGGVIVEAIEVKAHDDEEAGVTAHGTRIEGRAVTQVDQSIATLRTILTKADTSPVLRARRDVVREQLYRAVFSRDYPQDRRKRYVRLLEEFFAKGPGEVQGLIFKVKIAPGQGGGTADEAPDWRTSPAGNKVGLVRVTESGTLGKFRSPPPPKPPSTPPKSRKPPRGGGGGGANVEPPKAGEKKTAKRAVTPDAEPGTPLESAPRAHGDGTSIRVLIGTTPTETDVYWEPHRADAALNNFGILVTGDPGSGKTQMLKALIAAVADAQLPVCIFDFKNDYTDKAFIEKHGLRVYDIDRHGLPFNPLSLIPNERGEAQPMRQIHELVGILERIFVLGAQQAARLRKAIVSAFEDHGIRPDAWHSVASLKSLPSFNEVKEKLDEDDKNEALLNRLSPLFDLNLFPDVTNASTTFERLIQDRIVLDLHTLPTNEIKAAMSEFIIVRLHGFVLKGDQPRVLRRLMVFDEAWRVASSVRLQELAREGRAFGVGIAIGTQFPGDLPETLGGNLATQLLLANQDADHRKAVVRTLCGATSGNEASRLLASVAMLQQHDGYFRNQHHAPYVLVKTLPYYRRA